MRKVILAYFKMKISLDMSREIPDKVRKFAWRRYRCRKV